MIDKRKLMSGADVFASILEKEEVNFVFAYPGTSELALCNAIINTSKVELINGRGDKESAFMAAGGSFFRPSHAVAILHGARGLTNAAGAIADANRNEVGTVFFVGLPSSTSLRFLPPHGEKNLIKSIGNFVKQYDEVVDIPKESDDQKSLYTKAVSFIGKIKNAIHQTQSLPRGPTLLGIPQDVSEHKWVPQSLAIGYQPYLSRSTKRSASNRILLQKVVSTLRKKNRPVIIVDDYLFKYPVAKEHLLEFAKTIKAPIFQVFYGRGPMLFESLTYRDNPYFIGHYKPQNALHKKVMEETDLLITLEDRNMYARVVGILPDCQKIAFTSNPAMSRKNGYLKKTDILISGSVVTSLQFVSTNYTVGVQRRVFKKHWADEQKPLQQEAPVTSSKNYFIRNDLAGELARIFVQVKRPVLVDDSQMFGGLLAENYEKFPKKLRVFGDHGAFIGGGLASATGLAHCEKDLTVFCTIGDQSFTNALQGLVAAVEKKVNIKYIICNNGKSVSLMKQILSQDPSSFQNGKNPFLANAPFSYSRVAEALGLTVFTLNVTFGDSEKENQLLQRLLRKTLEKALKKEGPVLIELKMPSNFDAWKGIWSVKGNEQ